MLDKVQSLLSILRHRTVEKSVERCELSIIEGNEQEGEDNDTLESKLIVRLHCKHGILIVHLIRTDCRLTLARYREDTSLATVDARDTSGTQCT